MTNEGEKRTVEEDFVESWDGVERFYSIIIAHGRGDLDSLVSIFDLIAQLRERAYDRKFRAGLSLHNLIFSRSLKHGLRDDQPCLIISLDRDRRMYLWYCERPDVDIQLQTEKAELTPEVEALLHRLLEHPLD